MRNPRQYVVTYDFLGTPRQGWFDLTNCGELNTEAATARDSNHESQQHPCYCIWSLLTISAILDVEMVGTSALFISFSERSIVTPKPSSSLMKKWSSQAPSGASAHA